MPLWQDTLNQIQPGQAYQPPAAPPPPKQGTSMWSRIAQVGVALKAKADAAIEFGKQYELPAAKQVIGKDYPHWAKEGLQSLTSDVTGLGKDINKNIIQPVAKPQRSQVGGNDLINLQSQFQQAVKQGKVSFDTLKVLKQVQNPQAKIKAYQMATSGTPDKQIRQFLLKQQQAQTSNVKRITGEGMGTVGLLSGGGEAVTEAEKALTKQGIKTGIKTLAKGAIKEAPSGAMMGVGGQLHEKPDSSVKELAQAGATGAGEAALAHFGTKIGVRAGNKLARGTAKEAIGAGERVGEKIAQTTAKEGTNIPVKSVESTTKIPVRESGYTDARFRVAFSDTAKKVAKTTPAVAESYLKTGSKDSLTLITHTLANTENTKKISSIVDKMIPGLNADLRRQTIKGITKAKSPQEVSKLLWDAVKNPERKIAPVVADAKRLSLPANKSAPAMEKATIKEPSPVEKSPTKVAPNPEAGSIPTGEIKAMLDRHAQENKITSDVAKNISVNKGLQESHVKEITKYIKSLPTLTDAEKSTLQAFRDAKASGLKAPELSPKLQERNQILTELNKQALKDRIAQATAEGHTDVVKALQKLNPESFTHRVGKDVGSAFDYFKQGNRSNPLAVGTFGRKAPSQFKRASMALTDSEGNRKIVTIGSHDVKTKGGKTVSRDNLVVEHTNGGEAHTILGRLQKASDKTERVPGTFVDKAGKRWSIGQATVDEISKATGREYHVQPELNTVTNYIEAHKARLNSQFIENTKSALRDAKLAVQDNKGTAPSNFIRTSNPYFQGHRYDPKVAEVLNDVAGKEKTGLGITRHAGRILRDLIVWLPVKHELNELAFYGVDRGLSSWVNPLGYGRMVKSLVKATRDVTKYQGVFKQMVEAGSHLATIDNKDFGEFAKKQLDEVTNHPDVLQQAAKHFGTSAIKIARTIKDISVWQMQNVLNTARMYERMSPGLLKKGMKFEDALKETEKFNLKYDIPSRVGPGKVGRSVSETLNNPLFLFTHYSYDKYRTLGNIGKQTLNISHPSEVIKGADKLAALAVASAILWPYVNKGIQATVGNKGAYATAPGPLAVPETALKVSRGEKNPIRATTEQISSNPLVGVAVGLQNNRDTFSGKRIYDPNASFPIEVKQIAQWSKSQLAPAQKSASTKNATKNTAGGILSVSNMLSMAGASIPKNTPGQAKLYSLQYDSLPGVQTTAKAQAAKGNISGAEQTISQYDRIVLSAAKAALRKDGKPVPSDATLVRELKKQGVYYHPDASTIRSWSKPSKKPTISKLF